MEVGRRREWEEAGTKEREEWSRSGWDRGGNESKENGERIIKDNEEE